jgi:hypothetical protein
MHEGGWFYASCCYRSNGVTVVIFTHGQLPFWTVSNQKGLWDTYSFGWCTRVPVDLYQTFCVWKNLGQEVKMHNGVADMVPYEESLSRTNCLVAKPYLICALWTDLSPAVVLLLGSFY